MQVFFCFCCAQNREKYFGKKKIDLRVPLSFILCLLNNKREKQRRKPLAETIEQEEKQEEFL
jgi:hypothetical protein